VRLHHAPASGVEETTTSPEQAATKRINTTSNGLPHTSDEKTRCPWQKAANQANAIQNCHPNRTHLAESDSIYVEIQVLG